MAKNKNKMKTPDQSKQKEKMEKMQKRELKNKRNLTFKKSMMWFLVVIMVASMVVPSLVGIFF